MMVFMVAFAESLAIVGSIIPGSVMMTMLGFLAGSGVMRIDLTMFAAICGAFAGDSASYFLGRIMSDRLYAWWPFTRYPHWLNYAKTYFERHGVKSVFLGRFIGPLRSFIPVIAGMMRMEQLKFLTANITSAILWAILYLVPGILLGTASIELSNQNARRLFMALMLVLLCVWCIFLFIRFMLRKRH